MKTKIKLFGKNYRIRKGSPADYFVNWIAPVLALLFFIVVGYAGYIMTWACLYDFSTLA